MKILFLNALLNTLSTVILNVYALLEYYQSKIGISETFIKLIYPILWLCLTIPLYLYLLIELAIFFKLF
jgi:hypothetical protein